MYGVYEEWRTNRLVHMQKCEWQRSSGMYKSLQQPNAALMIRAEAQDIWEKPMLSRPNYDNVTVRQDDLYW